MKRDRINYVLVGSFVLAMVFGLVVTVATLKGRTGATDIYYTRYRDATGVGHGTRVLYMGFPVGQVETVKPVFEEDGLYFELELALEEEFATWQVSDDSVAQVRVPGLLAPVTIDILTGDSKQFLAPGDRIRGAARVNMFAALSDTANTVRDFALNDARPLLRKLSALTSRLEQTLSDENLGKVDGMVDNVLAASEDIAQLTASARTELLADLNAAAADFKAIGASTRAGVDTVLATENLQRLRATLENVETASASARELLGPERRARVDALLGSAGSAADNLDEMITDARAQVRAVLNEETVARFNNALVNISTAAANVARLSANMDERVGDVLTPQMAARMKQALENFSRAAASVASLTRGLDESREDLDALLVALRGMAEENRPAVRASVADLSHSLDVVARHIDAVARNLEGSSRNMLEFSRRLKANPGLLLRGTSPSPDAGSGG